MALKPFLKYTKAPKLIAIAETVPKATYRKVDVSLYGEGALS